MMGSEFQTIHLHIKELREELDRRLQELEDRLKHLEEEAWGDKEL